MGIFDSFDKTIVRELNGRLEAARHAYYGGFSLLMTDAEYDVLEAQLQGMVAANPSLAEFAPVLKTVGTAPQTKVVKGAPRVKHIRPMLSIENQYKKEDVLAWYLNLPTGTAVNVEPKRDGVSNENRYFLGALKLSLTRGRGDEGEDQTAQVKALQDVPQYLVYAPLLDAAPDINIRGELVMRDSELDRINAELTAKGLPTKASTRNLTAGTLKQQDLTVVASREILFMPWDVYSPSNDKALPDSNYARMKMLEQAGFPKYDGILVTNPDDVVKAVDTILALNAKSDIRADGVVIKVDSHKLRKELGVASKFTNWMTCFKPQSASGTTYLRSITWQVGRAGALTPVATCDPVVLAGASVTRATLNNETWIATMGLTLGAKVEMLRSGDVIPQIVKVLDDTGDPIVPPTFCPECDKPVTVWTDKSSGITSRSCENVECPGRVRGTLSYIGSREVLEIDGLADDMAGKLAKGGYARNLGELFEFQVEALGQLAQLKTKFGDEQGETLFLNRMAHQGFSVLVLRMLISMENAKTAGWDKWLAAFSIPMVGRTLGKLLAKELKLEADDMPNLCTKLYKAATGNIEGLGDVKSDILKNWALNPVNRNMCQSLFNSGVRPSPTVAKVADGVGQPLAGMSFLITGSFDEDRDTLTAKLESLGGTLKSGVSAKLNLFIVGDDAGGTKLTKYNELVAKGAKIQKVGKEWLTATLEAAGMGMVTTSAAVEED